MFFFFLGRNWYIYEDYGNVATTKDRNTPNKSVGATPRLLIWCFLLFYLLNMYQCIHQLSPQTYHLFIYDICLRLKIRLFIFRRKLMHLQGALWQRCHHQIQEHYGTPGLLIWCFLVYYQPSTHPQSLATLNYLFIYDICSVINI